MRHRIICRDKNGALKTFELMNNLIDLFETTGGAITKLKNNDVLRSPLMAMFKVRQNKGYDYIQSLITNMRFK